MESNPKPLDSCFCSTYPNRKQRSEGMWKRWRMSSKETIKLWAISWQRGPGVDSTQQLLGLIQKWCIQWRGWWRKMSHYSNSFGPMQFAETPSRHILFPRPSAPESCSAMPWNYRLWPQRCPFAWFQWTACVRERSEGTFWNRAAKYS